MKIFAVQTYYVYETLLCLYGDRLVNVESMAGVKHCTRQHVASMCDRYTVLWGALGRLATHATRLSHCRGDRVAIRLREKDRARLCDCVIYVRWIMCMGRELIAALNS